MAEILEPRASTLADGVEASLLQYIRSSGLTAGDALPKEEELAAQMRVSRHIVREGISRLKTWGVVESRRRRGMTLARPDVFAGVSKAAAARLFSDGECREMMGLRVVMEIGMAEFIYRRKTPKSLAELRRFADEMPSQVVIRREVEFHTRLFAIGGNAMADQFQKILVTAFGAQTDKRPGPALNPPSHRDICDALERGTCDEFRRVLTKHFAPYTDW